MSSNGGEGAADVANACPSKRLGARQGFTGAKETRGCLRNTTVVDHDTDSDTGGLGSKKDFEESPELSRRGSLVTAWHPAPKGIASEGSAPSSNARGSAGTLGTAIGGDQDEPVWLWRGRLESLCEARQGRVKAPGGRARRVGDER